MDTTPFPIESDIRAAMHLLEVAEQTLKSSASLKFELTIGSLGIAIAILQRAQDSLEREIEERNKSIRTHSWNSREPVG